MSRYILILTLTLMTGCSTLDIVSKVLPSKPLPSISIDTQLGGEKTLGIDQGITTEVKENSGTISNVTTGMGNLFILLLFLLTIVGFASILYIVLDQNTKRIKLRINK